MNLSSQQSIKHKIETRHEFIKSSVKQSQVKHKIETRHEFIKSAIC